MVGDVSIKLIRTRADQMSNQLIIRNGSVNSGGFRNEVRGEGKGSGARKSPSGVQRQSPGGVWGAKPPEADDIL